MNAEDTVGSADHRGRETGPSSEKDRAGVDEDLFCPECGYNLRGVTADRCPECGGEFDRATLAVSRIPWVHRKKLGWRRAYWRTVWMAVVRNKQFAEEAVRPVDYEDAQRFRWVTAAHVLIPVVLIDVFVVAVNVIENAPGLGRMAFEIVGGGVALVVAATAFVVAATGVPSYFFHPRHLTLGQQNRLVALSYYACAPLGWAPLTAVLIGVGVVLQGVPNGTSIVLAMGVGMGLLQMALWWRCLLSIARPARTGSERRRLMVAIAVPLLWFGLAIGTLLGIPLVFGFVAVVVASLG